MTQGNNIDPNETPQDTPADAAAAESQAPTPAQPADPDNLSGSDAVNLAAEQSKGTAHRNIGPVGPEPLPVDEDTANLRLGPNLHDALLALLPLVGVWRGEGQGRDADGSEFTFGQQLTFAHDGRDFLSFESHTWRLDEDGAATGADQREVGYWRISEKDEIQVTLTSSDGVIEILYGEPYNERAWQVESASTMVTETGPTNHGPGKRLYGLMPNNDLGWVDERIIDGELTPSRSAQLKRIAG